MANEEHLKILKQGVKVWNQWRKEHPDVKPDLCEVDLSDANLRKANLHRANLHRANLHRANLTKVDLTEANLDGANLRGVRLIKTTLNRGTLTGAYLYGTARDDWKIDGIICEYVFWDDMPFFLDSEKENQLKAEHRTPKERDFRPGEFEELYKQLPTFEYIFQHGFTALDAVVMSRIVEAINEQHPEFELKLDSFHSRGQPHTKFTVLHKEYVEAAKSHITTDYESRIAALEGKQEQLMKLFATLTSNPQPQLISGCEQVIIGGTIMGDNIQIDHSQVTTGPNIQGNHAQQHITIITNPLLEEMPPLEHLTTRAALQEQYQLLSEKIHVMRKEYILETDVAIKFKLEKHLEEAEQFLKKIERQLSKVE